jgi:hypothetical protein
VPRRERRRARHPGQPSDLGDDVELRSARPVSSLAGRFVSVEVAPMASTRAGPPAGPVAAQQLQRCRDRHPQDRAVRGAREHRERSTDDRDPRPRDEPERGQIRAADRGGHQRPQPPPEQVRMDRAHTELRRGSRPGWGSGATPPPPLGCADELRTAPWVAARRGSGAWLRVRRVAGPPGGSGSASRRVASQRLVEHTPRPGTRGGRPMRVCSSARCRRSRRALTPRPGPPRRGRQGPGRSALAAHLHASPPTSWSTSGPPAACRANRSVRSSRCAPCSSTTSTTEAIGRFVGRPVGGRAAALQGPEGAHGSTRDRGPGDRRRRGPHRPGPARRPGRHGGLRAGRDGPRVRSAGLARQGGQRRRGPRRGRLVAGGAVPLLRAAGPLGGGTRSARLGC